MKDYDDPEPEEEEEEVNEALELAKTVLGFFFSKRAFQGYTLILVGYFSWRYTDFLKDPDECYKARPTFTTTLSIKNPNIRWEEFKGLEMRGLVKTVAGDGKKEIVRSYDILRGKPAEATRKYLLKGFHNSYETKVKGCVESVTVLAKIQTLSGSKAVLNESRKEVRLKKKFLSSEQEKANPRKTRSKKCAVELTIDTIDPMAQTAQVPTGNIKMDCR
jgi:hypothetical protein